MLTSFNHHPEDIRILTIIVSELELGNIEGQVLFADFVEGPDNATLNVG
jgi:hypothetical protein